MSKKQLLNEIIDLCDENEALKNKIKNYEKTQSNNETVIICDETENKYKELDDKAKSLLFDRVFYNYNLKNINVEVKEGSDELNFLSFEQWFKSITSESDIIRYDYKYLLNNITFNELKNYFKQQLKTSFDKIVNDIKMEIVRSKKNE